MRSMGTGFRRYDGIKDGDEAAKMYATLISCLKTVIPTKVGTHSECQRSFHESTSNMNNRV